MEADEAELGRGAGGGGGRGVEGVGPEGGGATPRGLHVGARGLRVPVQGAALHHSRRPREWRRDVHVVDAQPLHVRLQKGIASKNTEGIQVSVSVILSKKIEQRMN